MARKKSESSTEYVDEVIDEIDTNESSTLQEQELADAPAEYEAQVAANRSAGQKRRQAAPKRAGNNAYRETDALNVWDEELNLLREQGAPPDNLIASLYRVVPLVGDQLVGQFTGDQFAGGSDQLQAALTDHHCRTAREATTYKLAIRYRGSKSAKRVPKITLGAPGHFMRAQEEAIGFGAPQYAPQSQLRMQAQAPTVQAQIDQLRTDIPKTVAEAVAATLRQLGLGAPAQEQAPSWYRPIEPTRQVTPQEAARGILAQAKEAFELVEAFKTFGRNVSGEQANEGTAEVVEEEKPDVPFDVVPIPGVMLRDTPVNYARDRKTGERADFATQLSVNPKLVEVALEKGSVLFQGLMDMAKGKPTETTVVNTIPRAAQDVTVQTTTPAQNGAQPTELKW